jgi:hypothetical protein
MIMDWLTAGDDHVNAGDFRHPSTGGKDAQSSAHAHRDLCGGSCNTPVGVTR